MPNETWPISTQLWILGAAVLVAALLWGTLILLANHGYDVARGWPIDRRKP